MVIPRLAARLWFEQLALKSSTPSFLAKLTNTTAPSLDIAPYGAKVMYTIDPFGNRLRFEQEIPREARLAAGPKAQGR